MPRRAKGPRLYLDPTERVFVIRDGPRKRRTGCGETERERAEIALRDYIAEKYRPPAESHPARVLVADVLAYYGREVALKHKAARTTAYAIDRLLEWWGARTLSDVKLSTCNAYVDHRRQQSRPQAKSDAAREHRISAETARRELGVLRAAIKAYHAEHILDVVPIVTLPEAAPARDRWLTRDEAARFLRAIRRHPFAKVRKALTRFVLIGLYTGTRSGAVLKLDWMPSARGAGWIDVEAGLLYRRGAGERDTKKRRPPARIPERLLGHLRRWHKIDAKAKQVHVIGIGKGQRRAWNTAREAAGFGPEVTPHVLRHTAATWLMLARSDLWEASGFLGMSPEVMWTVYGHHHPDFQKRIAGGGVRPK